MSQCRTGFRVRVTVGPGVAGRVFVTSLVEGDCHSRMPSGGEAMMAPLAEDRVTEPPRPGMSADGVGPNVKLLWGVTFKRSDPRNCKVAESPVPGTTIGGSAPRGALKSPMAEITLKLLNSSWNVSSSTAIAMRSGQMGSGNKTQPATTTPMHASSRSVEKSTSAAALTVTSGPASLVGV